MEKEQDRLRSGAINYSAR